MAKDTFSAEERAAMRAVAAERKASQKSADLEQACLDAIAAMDPSDREIGTALHALVKANAPDLQAKTWYGMPAYATKEGKVVVFFRGAGKFGQRYATIGFEENAHLDEGTMWVTSYAVTTFTAADQKVIGGLIAKAVG